VFAGLSSMNSTLNQHVRMRREIFRIRRLGLMSDRTKGELDRTKSETISSLVRRQQYLCRGFDAPLTDDV
jgi:hypothetical protein